MLKSATNLNIHLSLYRKLDWDFLKGNVVIGQGGMILN